MQADATVADQYIAYPTDNGLLNQSRKKLEGLIDHLYLLNGKKGTKPRTYRRKLDNAYLDYSKKKKMYIPVENHTKFQLKSIPLIDAYL